MKPKHGNRQCQSCGKPYFRVQKFHVWTAINPGHRLGWILEEAKMCTTCFNAKKAQRIMTFASVNVMSDQRLRMVK